MEMTPSPMTLLLVTCSKTGDEGNSQGASLTKVLGPFTTSQVIQSPQEILATAAVSQPQQMIGVLNPDRTITLVTSLSQPEATNVHVIGNVATALKSLSTITTAQKVTNCQVFPQRAQMMAGSPGNITYNATPAQQIHNTRIDDKKAICIPAELSQTFQLTNKHIFTPTGQTFLQPQSVEVPTSVQNGGQALLHGMTQIGGQNVTIRQGNVVQTLKSPMPVQQSFPMQVPISSVNGQTVLQTIPVPVQTIQCVPRASILHDQGQPLTVGVPAHMVPQLSNRGLAPADSHVSKLPIPKRLHKPHKPYMRYSLKVKEQNDDALYIISLPNELMLKIFAFLKHNQLGQIARVCRRWRVLIKSPILWKRVDVEFSSSHESQTHIAKSFVNRLPSCVTSLSLNFTFYDDWKELLYFEKLCINLKKKCPHLERLILDNAILSGTLPTLVDLCGRHLQNIQVLVFRFCMSPFDGPARIKYGAISKIEHLDVSCCNFGDFNNLPFSRMPNLKRLILGDIYVNDSWFENETSFFNQLHILNLAHTKISSRTFQAIQNHAFNLQELYLCFTDIKDDDLSSNNSMFLHLKIICLVYCHGVTSNGVVSLIQSCQSLKNVYVDEEVADSYAVHPSVVGSRYMLEIVKGREIFHNHYFSHK